MPALNRVFVWIWFIFLTIAAIYIRVKGVNDYYYSEDELLHINIAKAASLKQLLQFSLYETHPLLGHLLRYFWLNISDDIWFSRSLSLLFSICMIPVYYRIGKILGGEFAAMCCVSVFIFSYGDIIQSYVARNYSIFLFFISISLYCYLTWCDNRKNPKLFWYTLFCVLAALTHFSAIFAIFSIAAYETLTGYIRKYPLKQQIKWAAVNAVIAAVSVSVYFIWALNGATLSAPYFHTSSWLQYMLIVLLNPLAAAAYVLPSKYIIPLLIFLLFLPLCRTDKKLRQFLVLLFIALGFSTFMVAIKHYYPAGTRHNIWVMPFVVTAAGVIIANGIKGFFEKNFRFYQPNSYGIYIAAIVIPLAGWMLSDAGQRFNLKTGEYQIKQKILPDMYNYLETLDSRTIIIAGRDDAVLMLNVYPYLDNDVFNSNTPPRIIAYKKTAILINPRNRRISTKEILLGLLKDADKNGMLKEIDNIVFIKTDWDVYESIYEPLSGIFECPSVNKRITRFPDSEIDKTASGEEKNVVPLEFATISKKEIFEQIIAPDGKAHACLK